MGRFGVGQPVPRSEDPRLLTGRGRYVDDITLPKQAYAVFVRSIYAHADIRAIDVDGARAAPGVLAVYTGRDVAEAGLGDIPCVISVKNHLGEPMPKPGRPLLVRDRARSVGDPIAMVVAETLTQAKDAVELIDVDYRPLPAVVCIDDAMAEGAPQLWEGAPRNVAFHWQSGDEDKVAETFGRAAHVVRLQLVNNRVIPCPMEPRAVVGDYQPSTGRSALYTSSQGAHLIRDTLAQSTLKIDADRIRVIIPDVGGAFGAKIFHYPEEALALWAAANLKRPIKWTGERSEAFIGDTHGRDQRNDAEAALDDRGHVLALRVRTRANMGAYLNMFGAAIPAQITGGMLTGVYAIPELFASCEGIYTNTVPLDAYRGAGRPEATYVIERVMDAAARQLNLPRDEIRRRNFIRPEQMPYRTVTGHTYDSGNFARNMDDSMAAAGWAGFEGHRAEALERGRLRGIGMSTYVEICGFDAEQATIGFCEDGMIEILIGTQSAGHGHETAYAQIASDGFGLPNERFRVVQGDTDRIPTGKGTGGSRSLPVGGPAVSFAVDAVITRGKRFAAHLLQAEADSVTYDQGRFAVAGTDRGIDLGELAKAARNPENLPPGETQTGLEASGRFKIEESTYPNGCHICEVEIDPETGATEIVGYTVVDDFGTIVNPLLLEGQIHGGVVQGIGQALMEQAVYDRASGQLLSGSFANYAIPRASDVPRMTLSFNAIPCTTNPLGIKGAGEAGAIAACPAVINAVVDALAPHGVQHVDMPATPETIWRALSAT